MPDHDTLDPFERRLLGLLVAHTEQAVRSIDAVDVAHHAAARGSVRGRHIGGIDLRLPRLDPAWIVVALVVTMLLATVLGAAFVGRSPFLAPPWSAAVVTAGDRPILASHPRGPADGDRRSSLIAIDPDSGHQTDLGPGILPRWSPRGDRINFQVPGEGSTSAGGLWVMRADGSERQLVAEGVLGPAPWSPDAARLAATYPRYQIVSADGSGSTDLGSAPWKDGGAISWAPDGAHVAFSIGPDEIDVVDVRDPSSVTRLTAADGVWQVAWSPDGSAIAYDSLGGVRLIAPDGTQDRLLAGHDPDVQELARSLRWSPNGGVIAYASLGSGVHVVDAATGNDRVVFAPRPGSQVVSVVWAADGQRLAVLVGGSRACVGLGADGGSSTLPASNSQIWIVGADGRDARLIASDVDCVFFDSLDW